MKKGLFQLLLLAASVSLAPSMERKYYLIKEKVAWYEAQDYCRDRYVDLATVDSVQDMSSLLKEAQDNRFNSTAWIGLYNDINSWHWSYGNAPLVTWTTWDVNQPDNKNGNEECVAVLNGHWKDATCTLEKPFVCINGTNNFIFISTNLTWLNAQSYCRQNYTDLAYVSNINSWYLIEATIRNTASWIGLSRHSWKWSDQTKPSKINWMSGKPDNAKGGENCGSINNGLIDDTNCSSEFYFFCYSFQAKEQLVRLELQSEADVNNPAFRAALLEQINVKLKAQGMADDTMLKWREQPDGAIFAKKKTII